MDGDLFLYSSFFAHISKDFLRSPYGDMLFFCLAWKNHSLGLCVFSRYEFFFQFIEPYRRTNINVFSLKIESSSFF